MVSCINNLLRSRVTSYTSILETEGVSGTQRFQCPNQKYPKQTGRSWLPYLEGKRSEKRLRLELVKKQHHSQEPGFRMFGYFVVWTAFMFLPGFRHDYKVVWSLTWAIMVTGGLVWWGCSAKLLMFCRRTGGHLLATPRPSHGIRPVSSCQELFSFSPIPFFEDLRDTFEVGLRWQLWESLVVRALVPVVLVLCPNKMLWALKHWVIKVLSISLNTTLLQ